MDKDLRKIRKALEAQGFETELTRKGHLMVFKDGRAVATFSGTTSDWRALKNALAKLRRGWVPVAALAG